MSLREELYSQCFDEIIRQVTLKCPERGLLLMRVRDEIKMTIAAYQTLYQSSDYFWNKKTITSWRRKIWNARKKRRTWKEKIRFENQRAERMNKKEALSKKYEEKQAADEAKEK